MAWIQADHITLSAPRNVFLRFPNTRCLARCSPLDFFSWCQFFPQDYATVPVWVVKGRKMTVPILTAEIAPQTHKYVVVAICLLVLIFLIVEIPLILSIFKNSSKDENPKKMDK